MAPSGKNRVQRDRWTVQDRFGLHHDALVVRTFNSNDNLIELQVSTGCCPCPTFVPRISLYSKMWPQFDLPPVTLSSESAPFLVTRYNTRAEVTCLQCLNVPDGVF